MKLYSVIVSFFALAFFCNSLQAQSKKEELVSLLTDMEVQIDMTDAVNNMYNFKFAQAESAFLQLRDRHPHHPLPYFLMGLSSYWKMQPNDEDTRYDNTLIAYMDSSIRYAEPMSESKDEKIQVEGAFFLSAAYGFKGRIYSERTHWAKAISAGKNAMHFLQRSKNNGDLSPEFMFGDGLYNYYAEWIPKNYKLLAPVVALFPKGDMKQGIEQLNFCSNNAFFTRTEAQSYLMRIYAIEEQNVKAAFPIAKYLHQTFPDNSYFQRFYCRLLFSSGNFVETEKIALNMISKIDSGYFGYEAVTGRYACYMLGYIYQFKKDYEKAKLYFKRTVDYGEQANALKMGYYLHACSYLGKIMSKEGKTGEACLYFEKVKKNADKKDDERILNEAKEFLSKNDCKK
jgi:hypothetical protein